MVRLPAPPKLRLSCAPAVPPRATTMCVNHWTSRCVRRAQGAATVGRRSVQI